MCEVIENRRRGEFIKNTWKSPPQRYKMWSIWYKMWELFARHCKKDTFECTSRHWRSCLKRCEKLLYSLYRNISTNYGRSIKATKKRDNKTSHRNRAADLIVNVLIVLFFPCFCSLFSLSPCVSLRPMSFGMLCHYPTYACSAMNTTVQRLWTALHQLHQRETTAILQPSYVRTRTRGVQERRHRLGIHWLRHGSPRVYRTDREGILIIFSETQKHIKAMKNRGSDDSLTYGYVCRCLLKAFDWKRDQNLLDWSSVLWW